MTEMMSLSPSRSLLRPQECPSYQRGLRKEEVLVKRQIDEEFRVRLDETRFRAEPLGSDRYNNRYWHLAKDYSRLWVERPKKDGEGPELRSEGDAAKL